MITRIISFVVMLLAIASSTTIIAQSYSPVTFVSQDAVAQKSVFNLLEHDDILEITIHTDMAELLEGEGKESYVPAQISYKDLSDNTISWDIETRQRGKFRRRVCDFPPLKLRFDKDELKNNGLKTFHTLKLVTHCIEDSYEGKNNVLREYLAYKLYNELTDKSLKAQVVRVTYIDTKKKHPKIKKYGFIIENHHEMADRLGGKVKEYLNPDYTLMNKKAEIMVAMFQYMIGNEDWDVVMGRNIKLVEPNNAGLLYAVPYDFDFSGIVDAKYARPNVSLGMTSVLDRYYQGTFKDRAAVSEVLTQFQIHKDDLYATINDFKLLDKLNRKVMSNYLDTFFQELEYDTIVGESSLQADTED